MRTRDPLEVALDALGYRGAEGLVADGAASGTAGRAFVWRELQTKGRLDAAYFRGAVPLVGFVRARDRSDLPPIRRRLWNLSRVPLLIASTRDEVGAYSCFAAPPANPQEIGSAELRVASVDEDVEAVLREFSRFHVESGRFIASYPEQFDADERVDARLLQNLRSLRGRLTQGPGRASAIDALIGRSIFVRYFEDRKILSEDHLAQLGAHGDFMSVLRSGVDPTYSLFKHLAFRFNGDVFAFDPEERRLVTPEDLAAVADFFGGADVASQQQGLFPYDFSVIPSELVSSIYEQLLEDEQTQNGAHYTPRHVVDLVLDEVLPWEDIEARPKVLDPACGSGIFLGEAFRRFVFRERCTRSEPPTVSELAALLTRLIYGVDISAAAVQVAAFGLYLALLEEIDPPSAWRDARLPKLIGTNLIVSDFFSTHALSDERFDVVVGNPPWQSTLTSDAKTYLAATNRPVADLQAASAFLWRAADVLAEGGILGLVLPARAILHNTGPKAVKVRNEMLTSLQVESVFDLTALRHDLFRNAIAPAAAVVARRLPSDHRLLGGREMLHVAPRSSPLQATIDGFVVSHLDVHTVSDSVVRAAPDAWKTLLWGTHRDVELILRLRSEFPRTAEVAGEHGWAWGMGVTVGSGSVEAPHLLGKTLVPTKAIRPFALAPDSTETLDDGRVERQRNPRLFEGPHVLIKRTPWRGRPAAVFLHQDAVFTNGVVGFAGSSASALELKLLCAYANSSLAAYYHFMTSGSWGVERDAVETIEHLGFPFARLAAADAKPILAVVHHAERRRDVSDVHWLKALDDAVFSAYGLAEDEIQLVRDTLEITLDQLRRRARSRAFAPPDEIEGTRYEVTLADRVSAALPSAEIDVAMSRDSGAYAVATVHFRQQNTGIGLSSRPDSDLIQSLVQRADGTAAAWPRPATIIQPTALVLDDDSVHLVKPNELRYWSVSAAVGDAASILGAIARTSHAAL